MDFTHSEDRRMLADSLNRFVDEQYGFAVRERIVAGEAGYSDDLWRRFAGLGVIGALLPEADGGFGGTGFDIAVVFECLGRGLVVEPFLGALMAGRALALGAGRGRGEGEGGDGEGAAAHRERLAALLDGRAVAAFAHTEPGTHYEPHRVATRAVPTAQGWRLDGEKGVVAHGGSATFFVVSARLADADGPAVGSNDGADDDDPTGLALFVVPREAPGVSVRAYPTIDGGRAAEVRFEGVALDAGARLAGDGAELLERVTGLGLLAIGAEAIGAMDVVRAQTIDYLRTRRQFGQPIGGFQALQHRMADLLLEIEQARSAVINAAAALELPRVARERALSAAKYTIGRTGARVAEEAIQLHGGIGMTWELPLAHYAKRLVMIDHALGDEDHHLARYIALGRP
ncbi:acyl-CoA dehydrogenase family protein [Burkholderia plantarii]|uniref:Acyl-CoA dehydrogenase n=1 Tax=Burkholderia plantarii TaxID=41899 RepID=A0A0B6RRB5_BURPL|nr:acyl-CoA dehydrogenase family protein [Burkholderia plantarii]AJK47847.1 acyl-CoA dehydrogenase [Burkholderia plantarii]